MARAVMVIAFNQFRDEEYSEPKKVLEAAGINVTTASTQVGTATGKLGLKVKTDLTLNDLKVTDYDAVIYIGGPGSYDFRDDPLAHQIAQETIAQGKVLAAICAAPGILAKAGVLQGKKFTMFTDDGSAAEGLATYTGKGGEIDGKIITATGPETAKAFGQAIVNAITSLKAVHKPIF